MKIGLVLEGGGTRGIYTAGVLDAFLENEIQFDGVIGVSAGAIHGGSYISKQKGRSIRYYKKYCNDPRFMGLRSWIRTGDFIGADFCYHELPEKLDVYDNDAFLASTTEFYAVCTDVETGKPILSSIFYRKYPEFAEVLKQRYLHYNDCMKKIAQLKNDGKVLVIQPQEALNIGRLENNPEKTQEIYDVGYQDGLRMIKEVKEFAVFQNAGYMGCMAVR